ncbi:MAG: ribosome hibernation-promoting factor, HPF/YfiA family, partial [Planctomycetota bacterium]
TRPYLEKKLDRLRRLLNHHIESLRAFVSTEHERRKVELVVSIEHHGKVVIEVEHADVLAAIDLAVDRLERQLAKEKDKRVERGRRGAGRRTPSRR